MPCFGRIAVVFQSLHGPVLKFHSAGTPLMKMRDTTHLRYRFNNSHCILVVGFSSFFGMVALFRLFVRLFVNLTMREQTLIPALHPDSFFEIIDIREDVNTHKAIACKYLSNSIYTVVENDTKITFALDTSFPRHTSTSCH